MIENVKKMCIDIYCSLKNDWKVFSFKKYVNFISHVVKYLSIGLDKVQKYSSHLEKCIEKVEEGVNHLSELEILLHEQQKTLSEKSEESSMKLNEILEKRNICSIKQNKATSLKESLSSSSRSQVEKKQIIENELGKAEPALIEAKKLVGSINKKDLAEVFFLKELSIFHLLTAL